ncbi:hypothetical protein, partial [Cellulomonas citrea]|uniref:hypothetical protein n=1 Tax=Cellulomonas citrea TaxID=1909423 RepID=UPI0019160350
MVVVLTGGAGAGAAGAGAGAAAWAAGAAAAGAGAAAAALPDDVCFLLVDDERGHVRQPLAHDGD